MKITLERDGERVEIEGDGQLICDSVSYQHTFERQVKEVLGRFYAKPEAQP